MRVLRFSCVYQYWHFEPGRRDLCVYHTWTICKEVLLPFLFSPTLFLYFFPVFHTLTPWHCEQSACRNVFYCATSANEQLHSWNKANKTQPASTDFWSDFTKKQKKSCNDLAAAVFCHLYCSSPSSVTFCKLYTVNMLLPELHGGQAYSFNIPPHCCFAFLKINT